MGFFFTKETSVVLIKVSSGLKLFCRHAVINFINLIRRTIFFLQNIDLRSNKKTQRVSMKDFSTRDTVSLIFLSNDCD